LNPGKDRRFSLPYSIQTDSGPKPDLYSVGRAGLTAELNPLDVKLATNYVRVEVTNTHSWFLLPLSFNSVMPHSTE